MFLLFLTFFLLLISVFFVPVLFLFSISNGPFRWIPPPSEPPSFGQPSAGHPSAGQPSAGPPKISLFFSLLPPQFSFFSLGRRGSTPQPKSPIVHISGPWHLKHHHNSTKGPNKRGKNNENCGGGGKKKREILDPTPFCDSTLLVNSTLRWAPPFAGSTLLRTAHPSGSTLRGPHTSSSTKFIDPQLAEVEIGRSRSLPP